jgi:voltage-gated potassium channel
VSIFLAQLLGATLIALGKTHVRLLILTAVLLITGTACAFYFVEAPSNDDVNNFGDCLWWAVVTMSTVGYGDKIPETTGGRAVATILAIGGPVIFLTMVSSVGATLYDEWRKGMRGEAQVYFKDHIMVCGWNPKAKDVINELRLSPKFRKYPIVIIDDCIDTKPIDDGDVAFVRGNAWEVEVLEQANVRRAKFAVVVAEDGTPAADQKTVLTVLAIESIEPSIITCAEVNDPSNECHLRRANCDVVVNTNVIASKLLATAVENHAVNDVIDELVTHTRGSEIYGVKLPRKYDNASFKEPFEELKRSHNVTVIGIDRGGERLVNPSSDLVLKAEDTLLVISEEMPSLG